MMHTHKWILDRNSFGKCRCGASQQFPVEVIEKMKPGEGRRLFINDPDSPFHATVYGIKFNDRI